MMSRAIYVAERLRHVASLVERLDPIQYSARHDQLLGRSVALCLVQMVQDCVAFREGVLSGQFHLDRTGETVGWDGDQHKDSIVDQLTGLAEFLEEWSPQDEAAALSVTIAYGDTAAPSVVTVNSCMARELHALAEGLEAQQALIQMICVRLGVVLPDSSNTKGSGVALRFVAPLKDGRRPL